jgi:hypothetical protein
MSEKPGAGFRETYFSLLLTLELDILGVHDIQQNFERNDNIRVDHGACLTPFFLGEAPIVDDAHLLDDSGLAGLSSSCWGRLVLCRAHLPSRPMQLTQ